MRRLRAVKWLVPTAIGAMGLAFAAGAVYVIVCVAAPLSYADDDFCSTQAKPRSIGEEGTLGTERSSVFPPRKVCIYETPHHGRIVIVHKPF